ncbi:fatty acid desaturase family protein [Tautonia sociabilis]|uniref:Fatty acid desaturase n=1 Tax=Tautonia sociabilis TaxID=2080755 RepID=A0A432MP98_9BACT|nr:fatty acid desaturase [Tautonia sociabilis]RUL89232.1 fatty acid desaturase [Tautonia sociabilis]
MATDPSDLDLDLGLESGPDLTWEQARRALAALARPDNRTNLGCILREYAMLAAAIAAGTAALEAWTRGGLSTPAFSAIAIAVAFVVAVGQHRLSGLAHEASHFVLFRNRLANELAGDLLLMFPIVALTQRYRAAHWGHHLFVNDPRRDTDLIRLNRPEPHRFPISKAGFWRRYVLRALWPPAMLRYLVARAWAANSGSPPTVVEGAGPPAAAYRASVAKRLRGAYWLAVLAIVHVSGGWTAFGLFWVLPLLTFYPALMQLREIAHHANAPDSGALTNSRVFRVHPLLRFCVFPYGQEFHLTHHLFMSVPHDRLAEAHEMLRRWPPYRERVVVCEGYFFRPRGSAGPSLLDLLSRPAPAPSPSASAGFADEAWRLDPPQRREGRGPSVPRARPVEPAAGKRPRGVEGREGPREGG